MYHSIWVSKSDIDWLSGLPYVEVGDIVTIKIPHFNIDGLYEIEEVDAFGIQLREKDG